MGKLRDQMQMELELRNYAPKTIKAYMGHMTAYTKLFMKSPAEMGEEEIRKYLHHLKTVKKVSSSNINIAYCALRFFYVQTLHRSWNVEKIPHPKKEKKLPVVLAQEEVKKLLETVSNLKHRVILMAAYSGGLRVSEVAHLKIEDIDSERMLIRVEQGKGKKATPVGIVTRCYRRRCWRICDSITKPIARKSGFFQEAGQTTPLIQDPSNGFSSALKKSRYPQARHRSYSPP